MTAGRDRLSWWWREGGPPTDRWTDGEVDVGARGWSCRRDAVPRRPGGKEDSATLPGLTVARFRLGVRN